MSTITNIDLMNGLNVNPIPLEFSQSLTTTQWLCNIQTKVNEVLTVVNNIESTSNSYTDAEIVKIQTIITNNYNALNSLVNQVKDNGKTYTDSQINATVTLVNQFASNIATQIDALEIKDENFTHEIGVLYDLLQRGVVYVINPVDGQMVQVQNALNAIYELINSDSGGLNFTADMYEALAITADAYEALAVSARGYDSNWKTIFYPAP